VAEHPNAAFVRQAYDAMARGDISWMQEHTDADVVFHQGGRFPTAGTYKGRDAMFGHYMEFMQLVGEFSVEVHRVLADDEFVTSLITVTIAKDGRRLAFDEAHIFRVSDGLMKEMWAVPYDPYEVDEFFKAS
jgi:ketosteroid isomerase-like protein